MEIIVTNIPKDKFQNIQAGICKVLFENGIEPSNLTIVELEDGTIVEFRGFEFEIK